MPCLAPVVCRSAYALFALSVFVCLLVVSDAYCFVFLRLVYPMLSVSLDCFLLFVFLRLVYPMLSVLCIL